MLDRVRSTATPTRLRQAGFGGIPAPPTYPFVMQTGAGSRRSKAPPRDTSTWARAFLGVLLKEGGLILHGEQSFHLYRPIVSGDVLVGKGTVVNAYSKESNGRP